MFVLGSLMVYAACDEIMRCGQSRPEEGIGDVHILKLRI
jgi:hypothetical protein